MSTIPVLHPKPEIAARLPIPLMTTIDTSRSTVVAPGAGWGRTLLDVSVSLAALLILSPVLLVVALAVALESGRPVLFTQERVGRQGKLFRLFKFRTMRTGKTGPAITSRGDARVTSVGRFLRKFKLDELPQLWNVVRCEMSLVGPRPEVPQFVDRDDPAWQSVLQVRPGITDPASIAYRHEEELLAGAADPIRYYRETVLPSKLALNIAYLRSRSLWQDLQVIARTAHCATFPGAYDAKEARVITQKESE
jgi:lipopolysaccharide/colanic/teichoic acid biosynthesis glycosyltransferase